MKNRLIRKLTLNGFYLLIVLTVLVLSTSSVAAASLESLQAGTYVSFGGKIWQKFDYYNGVNGLDLDISAQTYLLQYKPVYQTAFDGRMNACISNRGYGWNDFETSQLKAYLNDVGENGFLGSLSNNSWVISKSDWSTVDQDPVNLGNRPNNSNNSCTITGGTGSVALEARVGLPSQFEWKNKHSAIATTTTGMTGWWTRTPVSADIRGVIVNIVTSNGAASTAGTNVVYGVRPSLHLKSGLETVSGTGTSAQPFCLSDGVSNSCALNPDINPNDCTGANATSLACQPMGSHFFYGGHVWQKGKFYNNNSVDNTAQTYLIMNKGNLLGEFDNYDLQDNLCSVGVDNLGYNDFSSSDTIYNNLNSLFYNSLPTEKSWIQSKTWSTVDDLLQNNKSKTVASPCAREYDGTGEVSVSNTKVGLMSAAEWNNRNFGSGLSLVDYTISPVWTRTPFSINQNGSHVRTITSTGSFNASAANGSLAFRPSLHLNSNIKVLSGQGTAAKPFCLTDGDIISGNCNVDPLVSLVSPSANVFLNESGDFNLSGFVSDEDTDQSLLVTATLSGITKTQVIPASVNAQFHLSWSAIELGDGFELNGLVNPITVTVTDNYIVPAMASTDFIGNISINFTNDQNIQPLNILPSGSIVYFGGRRFVKVSSQVSGESYLWQVSDEQQQPWHAVASSSNVVTDFYSNYTKLGYWLMSTYVSSLSVSQSTAMSWIENFNWTMGNETAESSFLINEKIGLPSYSEWLKNKTVYCMAIYGADCDANISIPIQFWLRTRKSSSSNGVWSVAVNGGTNNVGGASAYGVRPALNLKVSIHACGTGDGTYDNPYFLSDDDCATFNQPSKPIIDKIESYSAGTVIQLDDYKFIKMSDYLEPQRLDSTGKISNSYFVMADDYILDIWNVAGTNGCSGTTSGVCGGNNGWTDIITEGQLSNTLNSTFYDSLSNGVRERIVRTVWPAGGAGLYAAENDENIRTRTSKIGLISNKEWLQHAGDYCRSRQGKIVRNCGSDSFSNSWWGRTSFSSGLSSVWSVGASGVLSIAAVNNQSGVRPALNLISDLSPYCGSGTYDDPFFITPEACNTPPILTLDNASIDQQLSVSGNINFTGSLSDVDVGQQLNLKVQVMADDGVTPLYSKDYPISPLSPVNQSWLVSLNYLDLINLGERFNKVKFILSDGISNGNLEIDYTGIITLESLQGKVDELYKLLGVNLAGQIYYPMTSKMANVGDTYDGYTLLTNIDFSHQLWTQTLNAHPDMLSQTNQNNEQATPSSQVNTYLVKFFQPVQNLGVMSLSP